jgi:N-acetylglutamate synthase-like GNAT family acetyltransferase
MLTFRKAEEKDNEQILQLLKALDLYYAKLSLINFWVAEENKKIIAAAQLLEYPDFFFLGSVGVIPEEQGTGIASDLINDLFDNVNKKIYLYTIIPGFFERLGFKITDPIPTLPSKDQYECASCHSERCACMVWEPNDS